MAETVMDTVLVSLSGSPSLSVETTVSVSTPLVLLLAWYVRVARVALIWLSFPLRVRLSDPFAPAEIDAPPAARMTFRRPCRTLSCVLARLPSLSVTVMALLFAAEKARLLSSSIV